MSRVGFLAGFPTELETQRRDGHCCKVHVPVACRIEGAMGCRGWVPGTHHAIASLYSEEEKRGLCLAEEGVLEKDRQFAELAGVSPKLASYLYTENLPGVARYVTGDVVSIASFGAGYCPLQAVRPKARMRVARVLGPLPLVADVLRVLNLVGGKEMASLEWVQVGGGMFHIRPRRGVVPVDGSIVFFSEGLQILRNVGPWACVGASKDGNEDGGVSLAGTSSLVFKPVGRKGRAACSRCKKVVDPGGHVVCSVRETKYCNLCKMEVVSEGHELRCAVVLEKDARMELLGDAMHALDVKLMAVRCAKPEELSKFAEKYMCASAQKAYLQREGVNLGEGLNDHSWGSEFERCYHGEFRKKYLGWLKKEERMGMTTDELFEVVSDYQPMQAFSFC